MRTAFLAILLWFLGATVSFAADWVEARSENFTFVGQVSEKKAKTIVTDLEEYRAIIFKLFKLEEKAELVPVRIFGAKSRGALEEIIGRKGPSGVYRTSREGPSFILRMEGGFSKDSPARHTAYHEYTHHLISTYTNTVYPRWFSEGFADYLSTFDVDDKGRAKIGVPRNSRGTALIGKDWMPMDVLIGSVRDYPFKRSASNKKDKTSTLFYSQSWLAVHYIQSTPGFLEKFNAYLSRLGQSENSVEIFKQTFEMTPDAFGELLKKYYKTNKYRTVTIALNEGYVPETVSVRKLNKGEAAFQKGEAIRIFARNPEGRKRAEKSFQTALNKNGPIADIEASRALIALGDDNYERALSTINAALKLEPQKSHILNIAGLVHLDIYKNDAGNFENITRARSFLKQAMQADPMNISAHYNYVSTYSAVNDTPSRQAIHSALECSSYYRAKNFINSNMRLAEVLLRSDEKQEAKPLLEKARTWAKSPRTRNYATRKLRTLN